MPELVYVDTCVYLNLFLEEENKKSYILYKEVAFYLFRKLENEDYILLISDWLIEQLKRKDTLKQAEELFKRFSDKNKLLRVNKNSKILREANKYKHWEDAVHALIAIENKASCLITGNFPDFAEFEGKIRIERPEAF